MAIFKLEDRETIVNVCVYEIAADTKEEALDKYCNELAGSIEPVHTYTREMLEKDEEEIEIVE